MADGRWHVKDYKKERRSHREGTGVSRFAGHKEDGLTSRSFRGTGLRLLLGYWADLGKGETIVRSLVLYAPFCCFWGWCWTGCTPDLAAATHCIVPPSLPLLSPTITQTQNNALLNLLSAGKLTPSAQLILLGSGLPMNFRIHFCICFVFLHICHTFSNLANSKRRPEDQLFSPVLELFPIHSLLELSKCFNLSAKRGIMNAKKGVVWHIALGHSNTRALTWLNQCCCDSREVMWPESPSTWCPVGC